MDDNQLAILLLVGILVMVLFGLAIIAFVVIYQRRLLTQRETINRQEREHQRQLLASTLEAQEAERKRIAQDLHDSVGGQLSAAKLFLGRLPDTGDGQIPRIKRESKKLIDDTIGTIRRISQNLLPPNLENFGLAAAVEDLGHVLDRTGAIHFQFNHNDPPRLRPEGEVALFRIVQELVNNTLKHAEASEIHIDLHQKGDTLSMDYRDNGKGFVKPSDPQAKRQSLGLDGIESRVQLMQASWALDTAPGQGIQVHIQVPLQATTPQESTDHSQNPEKTVGKIDYF